MSKNLKVSPAVHEELKVRKEPGESFNDTLERVLGLDELIADGDEPIKVGATDGR